MDGMHGSFWNGGLRGSQFTRTWVSGLAQECHIFQWERSFLTYQDFLSQAFTLHWILGRGKTYESFRKTLIPTSFIWETKKVFFKRKRRGESNVAGLESLTLFSFKYVS